MRSKNLTLNSLLNMYMKQSSSKHWKIVLLLHIIPSQGKFISLCTVLIQKSRVLTVFCIPQVLWSPSSQAAANVRAWLPPIAHSLTRSSIPHPKLPDVRKQIDMIFTRVRDDVVGTMSVDGFCNDAVKMTHDIVLRLMVETWTLPAICLVIIDCSSIRVKTQEPTRWMEDIVPTLHHTVYHTPAAKLCAAESWCTVKLHWSITRTFDKNKLCHACLVCLRFIHL